MYCAILKPLIVTTSSLTWRAYRYIHMDIYPIYTYIYIVEDPYCNAYVRIASIKPALFEQTFSAHVTFPGHVQFCIPFFT